MRISLHDFGGYPYPFALSRALAERGHAVQHAYCASHSTTPAGDFTEEGRSVPNLSVAPLRLRETLDKFSLLKRRRQEAEYGRLAADAVRVFRPDVVVSANMPLDAQNRLIRRCRADGVPFIFWVQDLIGIAARRILRGRMPVVGDLVGRYYESMERRQLAASDGIVVLTEDFLPILDGWHIPRERTEVIHNWAPIERLPLAPRDNAWSRSAGLADTFNFVYAGTLGMKHNPALLLALARHFRDDASVRVVVLSQGLGADWLREHVRNESLDNLLIRGYEPFERMPDVMATADVLVAVLERDAGVFSVPSKVLAYLCGERPLLLAVPLENLAARIVRNSGAGLVVEPDDVDAFIKQAVQLRKHPELRASMGTGARAYAKEHFPIAAIADRFEAAIEKALARERAA